MRTALDKILRGKLEKTVEKARDIVEIAVTEALTRLGIGEGSAPSYLSEAERKLRNRLRAHSRQLGDVLNKETGKQETELLVNEMAYEHWHRMLFARFLEQSDLLMYDQNTHVTLDECFELAEEEPDVKDGWELAGLLAQKMLPQIFRADSPVFEVKLSINHVNDLEELIAKLHEDTFQASDALGWCYQFWQNKKKKQVNESGVDIGANELSPVTQLFTEPYMVSFLLDNALGAWWAKRRLTKDDLATATSEKELRERASIPGVSLEYLRFKKDENTKTWSCAAGDFDTWPDVLSEFKTLDPCCGSGHFLVAKLLMLVPIRMELEGLTSKEAIDLVLAQNIHGLELDQRCVELAAFALALEAWRYPDSGGYRVLPELQLACSGISISEAQKEWKELAKGDEKSQGAIKWMLKTFKNAPILGSLIDPIAASQNNNTLSPWNVLQQSILSQTAATSDSITMAQGLAKAAGLLSSKYQWVVTNVPYLSFGKFDSKLADFCSESYFEAKNDLANVFYERIFKLLTKDGRQSIVMPQGWLYKSNYAQHRKYILTNTRIKLIAKLGSCAFQGISGEEVNVILIDTQKAFSDTNSFAVVDVNNTKLLVDKIDCLLGNNIISIDQLEQLKNKGHRLITDSDYQSDNVMDNYATFNNGLCLGDQKRFLRAFYEIPSTSTNCQWKYLQSTTKSTGNYKGFEYVVNWGSGEYLSYVEERLGENRVAAWVRGKEAWNNQGILVSAMGKLQTSIYTGNFFDDNAVALIPKNTSDLPALWCYCSSNSYHDDVRKIDQSLKVRGPLIQVEFDEVYWRNIAQEVLPKGLPQPYSNEPVQWVFHGHPCSSVVWNEETKTTAIGELRTDDTVLQVAVARLLGYRWPAELDMDMELAPEMREIIAQNKVFDSLVDDDGIVCIPAVRSEKKAVKRLEAILHKAYGDKWSSTVEDNLLKTVQAKDLEAWLRDKFFDQHCKLFQHRPFIWQIWDGEKDGFSALVNYHKFDYKALERLVYVYLDDWIGFQKRDLADGKEGADIRLRAAENLKKQLEEILVGEEGLDIFVRWKSLAEQAIGWNPDLNDGLRLNIRPFILAKDVGKKGAGILRSKPNIHWRKDRGTDVPSAPWFDLGLQYSGKQGDRINDHHLTLAEKKAAKEAQ